MEYAGLLQKYKLNRPPTDEEWALRLDQKKRLEVAPHYDLSVIKINSTYMEIVDKYYGSKGELTFALLSFMLLAMLFGIQSITFNLDHYFNGGGPLTDREHGLQLFFDLLYFGGIVAALTWLLRKESFRYTHYPIRFNRKDRMVYVFRLDGTVLSVPWDNVFFTIGRGNRGIYQHWDVRGHILAQGEDKALIMETFSLSYWEVAHEPVRAFWEFIRRYMEEGPQEAYKQLEMCVPVDNRYEPFRFGFEKLVGNAHGFPLGQLFLLPYFFLTSLARYFAMQTSDIPVWPKSVEEACPIDPADPYIKDERINPEGLR